MNNKGKIYTGTGDKGITSLPGGTRIPKDDIRIELFGTFDELNASLGFLLTYGLPDTERNVILAVQNLLFEFPLLLMRAATPLALQRYAEQQIEVLEKQIDTIQATVPMPKNFLLPGGTPSAAAAHQSRTLCRRLERILCTYARQAQAPLVLQAYINRLSDYLYVLALKLNYLSDEPEIIWQKCCIFEK